MAALLRCATVLAAAMATTAQDDAQCETAKSCSECLPKPWCGWCSPGAVVYKNGTGGARCADQRDDSACCRGLPSLPLSFCSPFCFVCVRASVRMCIRACLAAPSAA